MKRYRKIKDTYFYCTQDEREQLLLAINELLSDGADLYEAVETVSVEYHIGYCFDLRTRPDNKREAL